MLIQSPFSRSQKIRQALDKAIFALSWGLYTGAPRELTRLFAGFRSGWSRINPALNIKGRPLRPASGKEKLV